MTESIRVRRAQLPERYIVFDLRMSVCDAASVSNPVAMQVFGLTILPQAGYAASNRPVA
ncbi:MAG TPA: hypothetical protein VNV41_07080 [Candidatus Acidoferrales bacterium]|nr:hypothetical protein [Candidatus Acidoferrales bacterium]